MRVSEVMTPDPVCCLRTTGIRAAAALLRQFDIGVLLVIDDWETRRLIGVVTDRDICLLAVREEYDPTVTKVGDCMATEVLTCAPDLDIRGALMVMMKHRVRRLPVVDEDNRLQGIVGISDLIRHEAVDPRDIWMALSRITEHKEARAKAA